MEPKNMDQIFYTFYGMLYYQKVELEKNYNKKLKWPSQEMRLKHIYLDEMQMLLEYFQKHRPLETSYVDVISDFRLLEEIFPLRIPRNSLPTIIQDHLNYEILKLTMKERICFLNWYLRQHHKFFKNSQNISLYHDLAFYSYERDRMVGLIPSDDYSLLKQRYSDYDQMFYAKQRNSLELMNYFGLPSESKRVKADQILKNLHMSKRYRDGVLDSCCKKEVVSSDNSVSINLSKDSKNSFERKKNLSRLHELFDGKLLRRYLNAEELIELRDLFVSCYGMETGAILFQTVGMQNMAFLEQKKEEIRKACMSVEEDEQYYKIIRLSLDPTCMVPYYFGLISQAKKEIQDLLEEAVFETNSENYEIYCVMIHEEFIKMQTAYQSLYFDGKPVRKKELL